jgi:beta-glucosidase
VDVTNTGLVAGQDVVQLYLSARPGGPARRLLAFSKVALKPGETKHMTLTADPRLIADFDVAGRGWKIAAGRYEVGIGRDAGHLVAKDVVNLPAWKIRP